MGYPQEFLGLSVFRSGSAFDTAMSLTAAVGAYGAVHGVVKDIAVKRLCFLVSTTTLTATAAKVSFFRQPTFASTTSQVLLGTLTIPSATAAGKVVYKDISPVVVNAGESIGYSLSTQGADPGTAAGAGFVAVVLDLEPETPANDSNMIASA